VKDKMADLRLGKVYKHLDSGAIVKIVGMIDSDAYGFAFVGEQYRPWKKDPGITELLPVGDRNPIILEDEYEEVTPECWDELLEKFGWESYDETTPMLKDGVHRECKRCGTSGLGKYWDKYKYCPNCGRWFAQRDHIEPAEPS
jgi:hypothetical protein